MATNIVTNWLPGADPTLNQPFQQNLTRAHEELSLSKYANNITDYTIEYDYVAEVAARQKLALVFAASMTSLGLNVKTVSTPWATQLSKFAAESMPVVEIGFYLDYAEAIDELQSRYSSATDKTFYNNAHIDNQTIENTIQDIVSTSNTTERYQKEYALQHTMLDMCVDIPLVQWQFYTAYQSGYVDLSQALKIPDFFSVSAFCRLIQEYPAQRAALLT
jgi:ABC-type transport system substrate-binding protein